MICKNCGTRMVCDATKVLTSLPAQYEYKCAKCGCMAYGTIEADWEGESQSAIDHTKMQVELQVREVMSKTMSEKLHPLVSQMTKLMGDAFEAGFDAGLSCGKLVNYNKEG